MVKLVTVTFVPVGARSVLNILMFANRAVTSVESSRTFSRVRPSGCEASKPSSVDLPSGLR